MTTHLAARMPHETIASLMEELYKLRQTPSPTGPKNKQIAVLLNKLQHVSRVFLSVIMDFRSTLPTSGANQKLRLIQESPKRRPKDWKPIREAREAIGDILEPQELDETMDRVSLQEFQTFQPTTNVHHYSAINTLLVHNQNYILRDMVDNGVNLRTFVVQPGTTGSGLLHVALDAVQAYVWINQLLLRGLTLPSRDEATAYSSLSKAERDRESLAILVRMQAQHALQELGDGWDNHEYHLHVYAKHMMSHYHWRPRKGDKNTVGPDPPSHAQLYDFVKDHLFPQLVRLSHIMLYNEMRHNNKLRLEVLQDATHRTDMDEEIRDVFLWDCFFDTFFSDRRSSSDAFQETIGERYWGRFPIR
jgi:hypothetical protein